MPEVKNVMYIRKLIFAKFTSHNHVKTKKGTPQVFPHKAPSYFYK